jgi:hypothetical protein
MAYVAAGLLGPDLWAWVCPVLSASIYTLNMGSRKVAEAATSGACVLAQLRGYAGADLETWLARGGWMIPDLIGELAMDCYRYAWGCCVGGFVLYDLCMILLAFVFFNKLARWPSQMHGPRL